MIDEDILVCVACKAKHDRHYIEYDKWAVRAPTWQLARMSVQTERFSDVSSQAIVCRMTDCYLKWVREETEKLFKRCEAERREKDAREKAFVAARSKRFEQGHGID